MRRVAKAAGRASGRFVLRLEPGLHAALRRTALELGLSLNEYCARKLAAPLDGLLTVPEALEAVERAAAAFGERLIGVAVFGSWARGEAGSSSDVDLLVVVADGVRLTRDLYREWDERPLVWQGRAVEPHFVHPPAPERAAGGLWAEVALDGLVLFERGMRLSSCLARVRRDIAAGRIARRVVHGQPYWTEVA